MRERTTCRLRHVALTLTGDPWGTLPSRLMARQGKGSVTGDWVLDAPSHTSGQVAELLLRSSVPAGYSSAATGPRSFRMARTFRPTWALVLTVVGAFFCLLGLLFLLIDSTETFDATVSEERDGVKLRITGTIQSAPLATLRAQLQAAAPNAPQAAMPHIAGPAPVLEPAPNAAVAMPPLAPRPLVAPVLTAVDWLPSDTNATQMRPPKRPVPAPTVSIRLAAGDVVPVGVGIVIGRDPQPMDVVPGAACVRLADPSLSRTHLVVGPSTDGVWVIDQHSTNGVTVTADGSEQPCPAGVRVEVPVGGIAMFGESSFTVVR